MGIIVLPVFFICTLICLGIFNPTESKKTLILGSVLIFSATLVSFTELLSLFHQLNYVCLLSCWSVITLTLLGCLYQNKEKAIAFTLNLKADVKIKLTNLKGLDRFFVIAVSIILLLIFTQGLLYPPNNWDAMTYHMARITSWISHQSLADYPTDITRQLYQSPFAEYVIMNFGLLTRSDIFSNLVQFFFLLFSLIAIISMLDFFGLSKQYKIIALVLAVTIPEVILQGSSTQNDIVVAFFILAALLFTLKIARYGALINYLFFGLCIGLGMLAKGTAYIYLSPILLLFGIMILMKLIKSKSFNYLWYSFLAVVLVIGINAGHFSRNYYLSKSLLGVDKAESASYSNQKMSAKLLASSIIKNTSIHMALMYAKPVEKFAGDEIKKLHQMVGIDINDPATNYRNMKFTTGGYITDEEGSANPFHFLLIVIAMAIILVNFLRGRSRVTPIVFWGIILLQALFFCLYLKWQPWHSRLHIPLFLISIPLVCYCFSIQKWFKNTFYVLSPILLIYGLLVILHTDRRPYTNTIFQSRYQKYFVGNPPLYKEYAAINKQTEQLNYKNIGLMLGVDDWEYPLFSNCFSKEINPVYINVDNYSKIEPIDNSNLDCIISTTTNLPYIDYKGKRFINKTSSNQIIYLYE
ncbi:ArnT family glycosyltransferase [Mucilaginibacter sp. X4EP1]|uniref:ArnT family glycosyltransferase n=1 Tax=Mucilaginibacter sp. X4EP1 TaxID=2723092 RepID=UPI002166DF62|nr:hypothetical protein [Mucilaginibacter sp. X4EP1]MCS3812324.1 hypothetical protein [Mucilaginibacter sp. X4EP1]